MKKSIPGVKPDPKEIPLAPASSEEIKAMQTATDTFYKKLEADSPKHKKMLDYYSNGRGADLNSLINSKTVDWRTLPEAETIRILDEAIAKYPPLENETFFFKGDKRKYWADAKIDEVKSIKGYFSIAARKSVAEKYALGKIEKDEHTDRILAHPLMIVIRAPKGSRGIYFGSKTAHSSGNEWEWLFPRNQEFKVLSIT